MANVRDESILEVHPGTTWESVRGIETRIKFYNIAGVPLLVIGIGIAHVLIRRARVAAK